MQYMGLGTKGSKLEWPIYHHSQWPTREIVLTAPTTSIGGLGSQRGFPGGSEGKASVCLQCRRPGFNSWVRNIPWRRKWQPTTVPLPGKSHGWRSLVGYSPWGRKESDTTERLPLTVPPEKTGVLLNCLS